MQLCAQEGAIYMLALNASIPLVGGAVALTGGVVIFTSYGGQPSWQPTVLHGDGISCHVLN